MRQGLRLLYAACALSHIFLRLPREAKQFLKPDLVLVMPMLLLGHAHEGKFQRIALPRLVFRVDPPTGDEGTGYVARTRKENRLRIAVHIHEPKKTSPVRATRECFRFKAQSLS